MLQLDGQGCGAVLGKVQLSLGAVGQGVADGGAGIGAAGEVHGDVEELGVAGQVAGDGLGDGQLAHAILIFKGEVLFHLVRIIAGDLLVGIAVLGEREDGHIDLQLIGAALAGLLVDDGDDDLDIGFVIGDAQGLSRFLMDIILVNAHLGVGGEADGDVQALRGVQIRHLDGGGGIRIGALRGDGEGQDLFGDGLPVAAGDGVGLLHGDIRMGGAGGGSGGLAALGGGIHVVSREGGDAQAQAQNQSQQDCQILFHCFSPLSGGCDGFAPSKPPDFPSGTACFLQRSDQTSLRRLLTTITTEAARMTATIRM